MSWDATLTDDRGHVEGDWNYTHNCNGMIEAAIEAVTGQGVDTTTDEPWWSQLGGTGMGRGSWWELLNGLSGPDGAAYLDTIIRGLESDPERFRAMNPENGWGDFDSLMKVLTEMRNAVPEWPTTWGTSG